MKKHTYLFKGVNRDIIMILAEDYIQSNEAVRNYIERVESVNATLKLNSFEAMIARHQLDKINKECNTKFRLLKIKEKD